MDRAVTSRFSFLRQYALRAWTLLSLLLWGLYWFLLFPAWQIFLHSDNVVPYIMTVEPWALQDFFYWGAERFGALYSVFWKVAGRPIFGTATAPFYAAFFGVFFLGTAFWLAAIRNGFLGFCFLLVIMPLMIERIDEFLYPGHVYGTLYFLLGFICSLLLDSERLSARRGALLGLLCVLTYWQHLLAGLIMIAFVALKYWSYHRDYAAPRWRHSRPFWVVLLAGGGMVEVARRWARRWGRPVYSHLETWPHFTENLQEFFTRGLSFHLGSTFGLTLLAILGVTTVLAMWALVASKGAYYTRLFVLSACLVTICCIVFFNGHAHYTENSRHERYFSFLVPLVFLAVARLQDVAPRRWVKHLTGVFFVVLAALSVQRQLWDGSGSILDKVALKQRIEGRAEVLSIVSTLEHQGCEGVIDDYWHAYRLTGVSEAKMPSSAADFIRNPDYFDKIMKMSHVCIADHFYDQRVRPLLGTRDCKKVDLNYWLCLTKPL